MAHLELCSACAGDGHQAAVAPMAVKLHGVLRNKVPAYVRGGVGLVLVHRARRQGSTVAPLPAIEVTPGARKRVLQSRLGIAACHWLHPHRLSRSIPGATRHKLGSTIHV
jgi:hypothetical protein